MPTALPCSSGTAQPLIRATARRALKATAKLTVAMANGWQSAVRVITTGPPQPVRVTPLGHRSPSPSSPPKAVPLPWITPREKLTSPEHSLMPMAMSLKAMRLTRMPPRKTRPTQARRRGLANYWCALALVVRGKTIPRPLSPLSARPVLLTS